VCLGLLKKSCRVRGVSPRAGSVGSVADVPPAVGHPFDHSDVLERAVQVVLLPVLSYVIAHIVLELVADHVLTHVQMRYVRQMQGVAEVPPAVGGDVVGFADIEAPYGLLLQELHKAAQLLVPDGVA
jgi:hypothetical protein